MEDKKDEEAGNDDDDEGEEEGESMVDPVEEEEDGDGEGGRSRERKVEGSEEDDIIDVNTSWKELERKSEERWKPKEKNKCRRREVQATKHTAS